MGTVQFEPAKFRVSTIDLHHEPYGPIMPTRLVGANQGKLAVITGAGRGLGRAISIALANSGANLALLDVSLEGLQETKRLCGKYIGIRAEIFNSDITDVQAIQDTFTAITRTLGPVDILVNNAGVAHPTLLSEEGFEGFWNTTEVNFKGTMLCMFQVLRSMREGKSGCIINMASRAATVDMKGSFSYNASKAAIVRATSSLQEELEEEGLGQQLHTYCLHPGAVWGALIEENTPSEVQQQIRPIFKDAPELCANTVTYLAAGRAKELRGHYFDCRQDIERVSSLGRKTLQDYGLYNLTVKFLPGYENEP